MRYECGKFHAENITLISSVSLNTTVNNSNILFLSIMNGWCLILIR